jgi:tRNA(fMet)-specific endonuclease VapC
LTKNFGSEVTITADRFGRVAAQLRKAGKPIPSNDIWIAAQALETGADLATFDQHFATVPGLVVRSPAS